MKKQIENLFAEVNYLFDILDRLRQSAAVVAVREELLKIEEKLTAMFPKVDKYARPYEGVRREAYCHQVITTLNVLKEDLEPMGIETETLTRYINYSIK